MKVHKAAIVAASLITVAAGVAHWASAASPPTPVDIAFAKVKADLATATADLNSLGSAISAQTTTTRPATTTTRPATTTTRPATTTTRATTTTVAPTTTTVAPTTTTTIPASGGRPFSASSPFNTPTPAGTTWFNTPTFTTYQNTGTDQVRHWYVNTNAMVVWYGTPSDPVWTFNLPDYIYPPSNRNRPAQTIQMRGPANMTDGGDSDHIVILVDTITGNFVEVWNADVNQANKTVTNFPSAPGWATGNIVTSPGAGTLGGLNDGVRAANFSWLAGLITAHDLAAATIDHALALALPWDMLKGGGSNFRAPATSGDFGGWGGAIWMGSRIGIPAGVAKPVGLSPLGSMMFDALQTYGAFVGDFGGGPWPMFYADKNTVTETQMLPLFAFWDYGGQADMEKIAPLLRVADYQP